MTIKPGPKTTRKVSRLCSHLLFTTVPRTEVASTSTSTAAKGINLFVIGTSPFSGSECVCSTGTNRTTMSLSRREAVGPEVRRVTVWQEMSEGEGQMAFGPRERVYRGRHGDRSGNARELAYRVSTAATACCQCNWEADRRVPYRLSAGEGE